MCALVESELCRRRYRPPYILCELLAVDIHPAGPLAWGWLRRQDLADRRLEPTHTLDKRWRLEQGKAQPHIPLIILRRRIRGADDAREEKNTVRALGEGEQGARPHTRRQFDPDKEATARLAELEAARLAHAVCIGVSAACGACA